MAANTVYCANPANHYYIRAIPTSANATAPSKRHNSASGYNLTSAERVTIPPRQRATISTGLLLHLPLFLEHSPC